MGYVYLGLITLVFARVYLMHLELHNLIKSENKKTRDKLINKFDSLYNVSNRRELLVSFLEDVELEFTGHNISNLIQEDVIDDYIKRNK
jgi:hypothetical protein